MKQFAVIGLGAFGNRVATRLAENGCDILAMDSNPDKLDAIKERVTKAVIGDAKDKRILERLGLKEFDAVIVSLGEAMEASILCVLHLKELGVKHVVAKAGSDDHEKILKRIGAEKTINPESNMAKQLADAMSWQGVMNALAEGEGYVILEIAPPPKAIGKSIIQFGFREKYNVIILMVKDVLTGENDLPPDPNAIIKNSDMLVVMGAKESIDKMYE